MIIDNFELKLRVPEPWNAKMFELELFHNLSKVTDFLIFQFNFYPLLYQYFFHPFSYSFLITSIFDFFVVLFHTSTVAMKYDFLAIQCQLSA